MRSTESQLLRVALDAHNAAGDPTGWPPFLASYASLVRADATALQRHYLSERRSELIATFGMAEGGSDRYHEHYSRLNIWRERGRQLYVAGRVILDPELCPRSLLKRSAFYNEFLLSSGGTHGMAGVISRRTNEVLVLSALRQDRRKGWEEPDRPGVAVLLPHVARARAAEEQMQRLEGGEAVFNTLNVGILFLGSDGRVILFNGPAEQVVLHDRDGLALCQGRIVALEAAADHALQWMLQHAVAPDFSLAEAPRDVLAPRRSFRRPYHVVAHSLRRTNRSFLGMAAPAAVVVITDPERQRPVTARALRQAYGLTPTETALAMALGEGHSLEHAAERLTMQYETARTHLRHILSKTQTARQVELVQLLERLSR
jgi:DNA-binding CsgD family transcriptional regulator/PAS domain-containing protein